jgi:hypothetical protein
MSFSTKISFVPRDSGVNVICFDNVDFGFIPVGSGFHGLVNNLNENFKFLNFRQINSDSIDFVTTLNNEEILMFLSSSPEFMNKNLDVKDFIHTDFKIIRYNWALIEIYEWESGY